MKNTMKHNNLLILVLASLAVLLPLACENPTDVGLGAAVDLTAPDVQVTAPDYMANVPEEFTLTGTVADDRDITEILVEFKPGIRWWRWNNAGEGWMTSTDQTAWTAATGALWTPVSEKEGSWSVPVSLAGSSEGEYTFRVTATDSRGNTSADSVKERTFVIDNTPPTSFVTSPVLRTQAELDPLVLGDPEQMGLMFNETLVLSGYQEENRNIASLRVRLVDGGGHTCYETILGENTTLWPASASGNLWNWTLTIPGNLLLDDGGIPLAGKNTLQVITVSTDRAGNADTVNAGRLCWWPESDTPWATVPADSEVYPGTTIMGNSFDDDGVAEVRFTLRRPDLPAFLQESEYTPASPMGTCTWSLTAPAGTGSYTLTVVPVDDGGAAGTPVTMNFTVPDIRVPQVSLTTPDLTASLFGNAAGSVSFAGTATDDQGVAQLKMAWVKPGNDETPFLSGNATPWNIPSGSVYTDGDGNIIWLVTLGAPVTETDGRISRSFSRTVNLFSDLGIGSGVVLGNQQFILRASDAEGLVKTQKAVTTGDWNPPVLDFNTVIVKSGATETPYAITSGLNLPMMNPGDQVMVTGTWTDDSTTVWSDRSRIGAASLLWNGTTRAVTVAADGTWSTGWFDPGTSAMATLEASLADLGSNTAILRGSLFIETYVPTLTRISSAADDGVYGAGILIPLYLEFNKDVTFSGGTTPTLTLNNGRTAAYLSGNGTRVHTFGYTVAPGDDTAALNVTALTAAGNTWRDSSLQTATMTLPTGVNSLAGNRTLKIDTVAPTLTGLRNLTGAGSYKAGRVILIEATFSETVNYTGSWTLSLDTGATATLQSRIDGRTLLFSYTTGAGQNTTTLAVTALNKVLAATLTDLADNDIASTPAIPGGGALTGGTAIIDTTAPAVPGLSGVTAGVHYSAVTAALTGEAGALIEYSLNSGTDWNTGTSVTVSENGDYDLTARQTDAAGNVSSNRTILAFSIDAGALVSQVTSSTADGTYKGGDTVTLQVKFRKPVWVTGTGTPTLLLNALDLNDDPVAVSYTGGSGSDTLTFGYTVGTRDRALRLDCASTSALATNGAVIRDAASGGNNINSQLTLPTPGSASSLAGTKNIRILAGLPTLDSHTLSADNTTLTLTFSQPVYKGTGNLVIEQDSFVVPPVLTETRYNEIVSRLSGADRTLVEGAYSLTINGGTYNGGIFSPDLSGKYVLKYTYDTDNASLIAAFRAAGAHQVTLAVTGSRVTGAGTMDIVLTLTGSYALPVMGAEYSLIIPGTAFVDQLAQPYAGATAGQILFTAGGIEPPVFRMDKKSETLSLAGATVTAVQPLTIPVKIDCPTPGTTIYYTRNYNEVLAAGSTAGAAPAEPALPSAASTLYAGPFDIGTAALDRGNKYYMKARAVKGGVWSSASSEAAFRTVIRYASGSDRNYGARTVTPIAGGTSITGTACSMWVRGSDCLAGSVTTPGFPFSWDDTELDMIRLMTRDGATWDWYWMTWDVGVTGYILFVVGATPQTLADAENGPAWYGWWNNGGVGSLVDIPMLPGECRSLTGGGFEALGGYGGNIHARPGWRF
jgi:hypothetical protein